MTSPTREWWTSQDLADAGLPDLPDTRQGVESHAKARDWRSHPELARKRAGRGGGWEYSWRLLPARAQQRLLAEVAAQPDRPARMDRDAAWAWFEGLKGDARTKAAGRLLIVQKVEALEPVLGRDHAVREIARECGQGVRTIWNWLGMVEGVSTADRLPYLADRRSDGAARGGAITECDPEFFDLLKSDYLSLRCPSFSSVYRRQLRVAQAKGLAVLPERTMRRRLDAAVSHVTQVLLRKGIDAVKRLYPTQVRDKSALHALEAVNGDYHKWDVFVRWPAERDSNECYIGRPQMVAFQDIYSGRILAWRVDQTANSSTVLLAAGDMISDWGIPQHVLLDNGREFAAKAVTGGTATRYRFKVQDEDIPGLFTALGCDIHWATPYSGQSKPIERAFRDMCDSIAKDPRFEGAWTGNRPDAKPEDYGSRAVDLEDFLSVVAEGIEEHNMRVGRRSEVAFGRSFVAVFDESYAKAPIRKATEAQRRLWLMGAKGIKTHSRTGEITFMHNRYWAEWMHDIVGQPVVVRFDQADLWAGLHVYGADGRYLGHAPTLERGGFFDLADAQALARAKRSWLNAEKEAAKAHKRFSAAELGRELDAVAPAEPAPPAASVIQLVTPKAVIKGRAVKAVAKPATGLGSVPKSATVTPLPQRVREVENTPQTPRELFRRALELERALERGGAITADQRRWLSGYRTTSEYRTERRLWDSHGDAIFG